MFKKSILTFFIVLCLVACFTLPCFASDSSSLNLLPQNMNSWSTEPLYDTMSPIPSITFTSARLENRIRFEDTSQGHSYCYVRFPIIDLDAKYTLDFDYYGNFSLVNLELYIFFTGDVFDLNNHINPLTVTTQQGSGASPMHFHMQFVPSYYVDSVNKLGIMFGFSRQNGSSGTNLYINNISLKSSNPLDTGYWNGPDLELSEIDISNEIGSVADEGGQLVNFLTTGFANVRKAVIGVTALFTTVWNFFQTYVPSVTWLIIFGLTLGLLGMIISVYKHGKESGSVGRGDKK